MKIHEYNEMMAYLTRPAMKTGGKVIGKPGGLVEPGVKYYAKAKYADPRSGIEVGDELGKGIQQRKIVKFTNTGFPKYITAAGGKLKGEANTLTTDTYEKAKEARKSLIEKVGGIKKRTRLEASWEKLSEDPLFEKFFKEQIETNPQIKKAMKVNNLTKYDPPKEIFNALSKEVSKTYNLKRAGKINPSGVSTSGISNLVRSFEQVFKLKEQHAGKLTVKDLVKKLDDAGIKTTENMIRIYVRYGDPNYKPIKYPVGTRDYITEQTRLTSGKAFKNTLDDLGIKVENIKNPKRPSRAKSGTSPAYSQGQYRFTVSEPQLKNLTQSYFFKEDPVYKKLLDELTSQSKKSDEYKLNLYKKDSENIELLKRNLNKTINVMSDTELKNWVEKNPRLRNLATSYFDTATGEIKNFKTLDEVPNLRDKMRFEIDHIRGRSTVKYDPATKKIMDGIGLEYPKNLYVIPRGVNNATKRTVENWVTLNPKETAKIKKIDQWFKSNDLTYWDKVNNQYRGATPKITNTDVSHLGLTHEQILLSKQVNPNTGELVIEKGPRLLERIQERVKFLQELDLSPSDTQKTILKKINDTPGPKRVKALLLPIVAGTAAITGADLMTSSVKAAEPGQMPQGSPGQLSEDEEGLSLGEKAAIGAGAVAGAKPAWKYALKPALKTIASPTAGIGFAGWSFIDNFNASKAETPEGKVYDALTTGFKFGENQTEAPGSAVGTDLLFPEVIKRGAKKLGVDLSKKLPHSLATKKGAQNALTALGKFLWQHKHRVLHPSVRLASAMTPVGLTLNAVALGHQLYTMGVNEQKRFEALSPEEQADERAEQEEFARYSAAEGGRVGFDEGSKPKSPGRRTFIKSVTALAALPIVGRFFKLGKVLEAGQYTGPAIEKVKGMPEWFPGLVKKLFNEGEDVTKRVATKERQVVKRGELEGGDDVDMIYDLDTGNVSIEVTPKKGEFSTKSGAYEKSYGLDYKKGIGDETTKGTPPDEFGAIEARPYQVGKNEVELDFDDVDIDDAISDLTELENFAKKKK